MNIKKIKLISASLLAAFALSSCSSNVAVQTEPFESSPATDTEKVTSDSEKLPETVIIHSGDPDNKVKAGAYLAALPDMYFAGASFIITSPDTSFFDPSEVSYISKSVSERNEAVNEKFNVTISCEKADLNTMLEDAKKSAAAGMFYSHVIVLPMTSVPTFAASDLLMNLRSMPLLDMSAPYFNSSSANALSFGNKTYGIAGEALPASDGMCALLYNKKVASSLGITDLYDVALDGELTWDKLHEYYSVASAGGAVAAVTDGGDVIDAIYISTGQKYISSAECKIPTVAIANYSMNSAATRYRTIVNNAAAAGIAKEGAVEAFKSGNVLFTFAKIGELEALNGSSVSLGMLPMPKADADSPYIHLADGTTQVFTVANGVTDSAMVSLVLSGLNAASYGAMTETVSDYLHASTLPDSKSADVYEIMAKSVYYDLALTLAPHYSEVSAGSIDLVRYIIETGDFSSFDSATQVLNSFFAANYSLYE